MQSLYLKIAPWPWQAFGTAAAAMERYRLQQDQLLLEFIEMKVALPSRIVFHPAVLALYCDL